jgi:hypothetical protein
VRIEGGRSEAEDNVSLTNFLVAVRGRQGERARQLVLHDTGLLHRQPDRQLWGRLGQQQANDHELGHRGHRARAGSVGEHRGEHRGELRSVVHWLRQLLHWASGWRELPGRDVVEHPGRGGRDGCRSKQHGQRQLLHNRLCDDGLRGGKAAKC